MKKITSSLFNATDSKQLRCRKKLKEAEAHLHKSIEDEVDAMRLPTGETVLLQEAQARLLRSETEARRLLATQTTILDALQAHIALIDGKGAILFVNEAWRQFAEGNALLDSNYCVGQNYIRICEQARGECAGQAHEIADGIRRVLRKELAQFSLQYPCHSPQEKRWFRVRVFPLRDPISIGAVVLHIDTTDIVQAEEAARQGKFEYRLAEEKLAEQASLLDQARDAILVRDMDRTVLFWNKGAERLYGWSKAEIIGRKTTDFLYVTKDKLGRAVEEVLEKGEWRGDVEQATKWGKRVIVESRWTLLRHVDGRPKSILIINSDITERRKIETELMRSQRFESIGTLAGGIAHDLNNMLGPILLGAVLLKGHKCNAEMLRLIDDIELSARRGADLVKQVLSFARGAEEIRLSVRLGDVVREVVSIIKKTFTKKITLKIDIAKDLWLLASDPIQLNQILLNLCVNARDAMPNGGILTISAINLSVDEQYAAMSPGIMAGRYVLIKVADTGCGIPQEQLDRIFDPFFTTKEVGMGTGLGLATAMGVVRSHGGVMNVYSDVGKGATFTIHLPAKGAVPEAILGDADIDDLPRGNGELILLVDDEASIVRITGKTLLAYGYKVLTACDGAKAVAVFAQRKHDIALVLTDMMMPVMDGPAAVRALLRISPSVKIIGTSGLASEGGVGKAKPSGVKHFLAKPYSAAALLQAIHLCLSDSDRVKEPK
jgi:PAS domain S-box-containing protein